MHTFNINIYILLIYPIKTEDVILKIVIYRGVIERTLK